MVNPHHTFPPTPNLISKLKVKYQTYRTRTHSIFLLLQPRGQIVKYMNPRNDRIRAKTVFEIFFQKWPLSRDDKS